MGQLNVFNAHPAESRQTYVQHLLQTGMFCLASLLASLAFAVHAVFPFVLANQGGDLLRWIVVTASRTHEDAVKATNLERLRSQPPPAAWIEEGEDNEYKGSEE